MGKKTCHIANNMERRLCLSQCLRTNDRKTKLECKRKKIKNIKYYFNLYT